MQRLPNQHIPGPHESAQHKHEARLTIITQSQQIRHTTYEKPSRKWHTSRKLCMHYHATQGHARQMTGYGLLDDRLCFGKWEVVSCRPAACHASLPRHPRTDMQVCRKCAKSNQCFGVTVWASMYPLPLSPRTHALQVMHMLYQSLVCAFTTLAAPCHVFIPCRLLVHW